MFKWIKTCYGRCTEFKADFGHVVLAAKATAPGAHYITPCK